MQSHGALAVDPHQQPVQPHHWGSVHPALEGDEQGGGVVDTGDAGIEERGAVGGHGGVGLTEEDTTTKKRAHVLLTLRAFL